MKCFAVILLTFAAFQNVEAASLSDDPNPFNFYHNENLNRFFYNGTDDFKIDTSSLQNNHVSIEFSLDSAPFAPLGPLKLKDEGRHNIQYRVVDVIGQVVFTRSFDFYLDQSSPTTTLQVDGNTNEEKVIYLKNSGGIQFSAYDNLSGVERTEFSFDGKTFQKYDKSLDFIKPGQHTVYFRSRDNVGNSEKTKSFVYILSSEPPVTRVSVTPDPVKVGENYHIGVNHLLSLETEKKDLPVQSIWVELDGNKFEYSKPFSVPLPGKHQLKYYSVDKAGNKEAAVSHEFFTDDLAPKTTHTLSGTVLEFGGLTLVGPDFNVKLSSSDDNGSTVAITKYAVSKGRNPASMQQYKQAVELKEDGLQSIIFQSMDKVGNEEAPKALQVVVDRTAPETSYKPIIPFRTIGNKSYSSFPNILTFEATDNISGVQRILYSLNDNEFEEYSAPIPLPANDSNKIQFKSVDRLGNEEKTQSFTVYMIGTNLEINVSSSQETLKKAIKASN